MEGYIRKFKNFHWTRFCKACNDCILDLIYKSARNMSVDRPLQELPSNVLKQNYNFY